MNKTFLYLIQAAIFFFTEVDEEDQWLVAKTHLKRNVCVCVCERERENVSIPQIGWLFWQSFFLFIVVYFYGSLQDVKNAP